MGQGWRRWVRYGYGLVLALAAGGLIVAAGDWAERRELGVQGLALRQAAEATTLGLQGMVARHNHLPYVVARHPDVLALLRDPARPGLAGHLNRYLADLQTTTGAVALFVVDRAGVALAASNAALPGSFVGQDYRRRPYVEDALAGRRGVFYGLGLTTGIPGLFIAEPVRAGDQIVGVVVVKIGLDSLEAAWARSPAPAVLQDARGIVFLSSVPGWRYQSERPLEAEDLDWLARHSQYGERRRFALLPWHTAPVALGAGPGGFVLRTPLDGRERAFLALATPIPELGWRLVVSSDLGAVREARREAQAMAALLAALVLLGVLYWRLREKRYAEQQQARDELERRVEERTRDLQEAHAFRKAMEDSLLVGMRARDPEGKIIYVNPALCEMVGYTQDELLGLKPPYPYWHPEDFDKHMRESDDALQGRARPHGFESRIRHRDGHDVITMVYTAPLIDARGAHRGWMSSVVDITAQKQAEARQREQERQLQRSARLASVGEMASTLAHELNQPLMAISNFAVAARAMAGMPGGPAVEMLASALDEIVEQSARASEIVKRVRAFINPKRRVYEEIAPESLVSHAVGLLQGELQRHGIALQIVLAPGLPRVRGDHVLLEQVLVNLIQNAIQAMQATPATQRGLEIRALQLESGVEIRVADRGPGIAEAVREQLFSPFFSTKSDGLGLGLSICRSILEAHGGRISVANRAAGGAEFICLLPASSPALTPALNEEINEEIPKP